MLLAWRMDCLQMVQFLTCYLCAWWSDHCSSVIQGWLCPHRIAPHGDEMWNLLGKGPDFCNLNILTIKNCCRIEINLSCALSCDTILVFRDSLCYRKMTDHTCHPATLIGLREVKQSYNAPVYIRVFLNVVSPRGIYLSTSHRFSGFWVYSDVKWCWCQYKAGISTRQTIYVGPR